MNGGPGRPQDGDQWSTRPEADPDDQGLFERRDSDVDDEVEAALMAGATSDADRAEALARATIARAEAARRATAARADALRRISDQHVEALRIAERDRAAALSRAQEQYEDEVRTAEETARHAIESACEASSTAAEAAHLTIVEAAEAAASGATSRDAALDEADAQRSETHSVAGQERARSVLAAYVAYGEALAEADAARRRQLGSVPDAAEEQVFEDPEG